MYFAACRRASSRMMSQSRPMSYSAAAAQNISSPPTEPSSKTENDTSPKSHMKRRPSPSHQPRTNTAEEKEENVYVLTLLTDKPHHDRMTNLRRQYFPKKLNKLAAHLTLFHTLPGSKLESSIAPTIEDIASRTAPFRLVADEPFRLKKGFAVSISSRDGGTQGKLLHRSLQEAWKREGFLSEQDAGGGRLHYTLMNKVDDEAEVARAFTDFCDAWKPDAGSVEGLVLWRYDRGFWRWERKFGFGG